MHLDKAVQGSSGGITVEIEIGPIEIDIEVRRRHHTHYLLAALGPFSVSEGNEMTAQVLTVQQVSGKTTSFVLGPYEKYKGDTGADDGQDSLAVTAVSSATTIATISVNGDGTSTVTLVPGASGSVKITFDDSAAGGNSFGELDITVLAPVAVPDVLVAKVGELTVV